MVSDVGHGVMNLPPLQVEGFLGRRTHPFTYRNDQTKEGCLKKGIAMRGSPVNVTSWPAPMNDASCEFRRCNSIRWSYPPLMALLAASESGAVKANGGH